jgi:hypothetical protein
MGRKNNLETLRYRISLHFKAVNNKQAVSHLFKPISKNYNSSLSKNLEITSDRAVPCRPKV